MILTKMVVMCEMLCFFSDVVVDVNVGLLKVCQVRSLTMRLRLYLMVAVIDGLDRQMM